MGLHRMASRLEAEADAGWPGLVDFLTVAGLKDAQLERALSLLANAEVSNIGALRSGFSRLAPSFKAGSRQLITNALAARGPQPAEAALPRVIFSVTVSFKRAAGGHRAPRAARGED